MHRDLLINCELKNFLENSNLFLKIHFIMNGRPIIRKHFCECTWYLTIFPLWLLFTYPEPWAAHEKTPESSVSLILSECSLTLKRLLLFAIKINQIGLGGFASPFSRLLHEHLLKIAITVYSFCWLINVEKTYKKANWSLR